MTTAQEVEEHANRIAMLGMGQSVVLLRQYARLIKTHADAVAALKQSRMEHYSCEDDWYSCPDAKGHGKCDCGAEEHNKIINDALAKIEEGK